MCLGAWWLIEVRGNPSLSVALLRREGRGGIFGITDIGQRGVRELEIGIIWDTLGPFKALEGVRGGLLPLEVIG